MTEPQLCDECGGDGECKLCMGEGVHVSYEGPYDTGVEQCLSCRGTGLCRCAREVKHG